MLLLHMQIRRYTYFKSEFYLITQLYYLLVCTSEICQSEKPIRYHGDLWNVTECEFCTCKHGKVQCFNAVCEPTICSEVFSKNLTTHLYKYFFFCCTDKLQLNV